MSNGDAKEIQMEAAEAGCATKVSPRGPTGIPKGFRGGRKEVQNKFKRSLQGTIGDPYNEKLSGCAQASVGARIWPIVREELATQTGACNI